MNMFKKIWSHFWIIPFAAFALNIIAAGTPNSDTFFLAATGKFIVENGYVPTINPFVIHDGLGMVVQQWLFDVLIYSLYEPFGNVGLLVFECAMFAVTMMLLNQYIKLFTDNSFYKKVLMFVCGYFYLPFACARPTIVTFPLMLAMLLCMEKYKRTRNWKYLIALPAIALLQVNLHSSMYPMLFVMMMPYVFPSCLLEKGKLKAKLKTWITENKIILLAMLFMLGVGFLNPNGVDGMLYVIRSYSVATDELKIIELQPIALNTDDGLLILAIMATLTVYALKARKQFLAGKWDIREIFTRISMTVGVMILACMHKRNTWYLILGTVPMVLIVLSDFKCKLFEPKEKLDINQWLKRLTLGISTSILICVFMFGSMHFSRMTNQDSDVSPMAAADYLNQMQNDEPNNDIVLYTDFNSGSYMEWRGYRVYLDARPELFHDALNSKENIIEEYLKVRDGQINYKEFVQKYNFTHLIASDKSRIGIYLNLSDNYKMVVDGNGYKLYERIHQ